MQPLTRRFLAAGHLIDSGLLTRMLNHRARRRGRLRGRLLRHGQGPLRLLALELEVRADRRGGPRRARGTPGDLGLWEKAPGEAILAPAPRRTPACPTISTPPPTGAPRCSSTARGARWRTCAWTGSSSPAPTGRGCRLIRDVRAGDRVVCTNRAVRICPLFRETEGEEFGFMASDVSSERSVSVAVRRVAEELSAAEARAAAGRSWWPAPWSFTPAGGPALRPLVRDGYVAGLLAGNALAVHDVESALYGTSLGIDLATGHSVHEGHRNHLRAINAVFRHGSIAAAVEAGAIRSGIMYELRPRGGPVRAGRFAARRRSPARDRDGHDAGPGALRGAARGRLLVLMLSTMLHSIATGNMLPAWVRTICVDINPAVVTKLADRGSGQTIGIVTDVGLFLRTLADTLQEVQHSHGRPGSELHPLEVKVLLRYRTGEAISHARLAADLGFKEGQANQA